MVTAGANQAYTNVVIAVLDADDGAVLFSPYYFNHMMALQMTGGGAAVVKGPVKDDFLPDVEWLERRLAQEDGPRIRMVTMVNPCNPTGVMAPRELLTRAADACARHGAWLVVDNTYEMFSYEAEGKPPHCCVSGEHVINVFSFSKAFGMMGWRVGYLAYPPRLHGELMKAQDTIAICPTIVSQRAALAAMGAGRPWVKERVDGLGENRRIVVGAIEEALGTGSVAGGSGAIYLMVRLPAGCEDDMRVVEWLNDKHKVCVIPGSACGARGNVRVCYANLVPERCKEAAGRLRAGLKELAEKGAAAFAPG
jgi:katanin p60 ATPase-containing subunit A1